MYFAERERAALKNLLLDVGPDAPTCCEGWTTRDLAIHLYLRERRPDAAVGMFVPALSGRVDKLSEQLEKRSYEDIVRQWGSGPPALLKRIDRTMNTAEHFVHHEDVRRMSSFEPRTFAKESQRDMYKAVKVMSRLLRKSPVRVVLRPEGSVAFDVIPAGDTNNARSLVVTGPVSEILLWVYGRPAVGLDFFGDPALAVKTSL